MQFWKKWSYHIRKPKHFMNTIFYSVFRWRRKWWKNQVLKEVKLCQLCQKVKYKINIPYINLFFCHSWPNRLLQEDMIYERTFKLTLLFLKDIFITLFFIPSKSLFMLSKLSSENIVYLCIGVSFLQFFFLYRKFWWGHTLIHRSH